MTETAKKVLFVLSGGGMPGLDIHAGMWLALEEAGINATHISGTSAGAIVGAHNAAGWSAPAFIEFIRAHKDADVRHERPFWKFRLPWIESIQDNDRIRVVLEGSLPVAWDGLKKPFAAWAVRRDTADLVNVARPELAPTPADACLASMAICGMFPSVPLLDGNRYIDGGVRFNLPFHSADAIDMDEVYLLVGKPRPAPYTRERGVLHNLVRNLNIAMLDQIRDVTDGAAHNPKIRVIWPAFKDDGLSMLHFDHDLIERAADSAARVLRRAES
jgi:predicted acylesterase/phospholipase RssA